MVPALGIQVGDVAAGARGGIIEEDVNPAERVDRAVDARADLVEVRDVAMRIACAPAGAAQFVDELLAGLVIDIRTDDRRALLDEAPQRGRSDAPAAAAHPCHLAVQLSHFDPP